jgi:hypothetical protein
MKEIIGYKILNKGERNICHNHTQSGSMYPETITNNQEASAAGTMSPWISKLEAQEATAMTWPVYQYTCIRMQLVTGPSPWL